MKKKIFAILICGIIILGITGCSKKNSSKVPDNIKIVKAENKIIKYTDFDNGLVKMKVPEGWKVDILLDSYAMYTLRVYCKCQYFL